MIDDDGEDLKLGAREECQHTPKGLIRYIIDGDIYLLCEKCGEYYR